MRILTIPKIQAIWKLLQILSLDRSSDIDKRCNEDLIEIRLKDTIRIILIQDVIIDIDLDILTIIINI